MKKYLLPRLMAAIFALIGMTSVTLAKEINIPTLIASGHPEWPPVMYKKGKNIVGAGPELVQKILNDLGIKVKISYSGSWENVLSKAEAGKIDLVVAAYKTKEREKHFVYSDSYTIDPVAVFVPADKTFKFTTLSDLAKKSGVGMIGDSYGQKFDAYSVSHLKLRRVQTVSQGFDLIANHKADYFLNSLYAGKLEIKKNQISKITHLPKHLSEQKFYIMISKKSPYQKYMPAINRLIRHYKKNGTVDQLITKHE